MEFDNIRRWKSDNLFQMVKTQPKEWFREYHIEKCEQCHGTGLKVSKNFGEGYSSYSWDCQSYCEECYGIGYLNIKEAMPFGNDDLYICPNCQSIGCDKCNNTGFVDWIAHAMGRSTEH